MARRPAARHPRIAAFGFTPGCLLLDKYEIVTFLGAAWESEAYLIGERTTGIERTAKFFFPNRNPAKRTSRFYARKLHELRQCPLVIQNHSQESIVHQGVPITFLVSEFVEGELLSAFLNRQPGGRLSPFQAIHLLHTLAEGIASIHEMGEYHGDLHSDNIIVQRYGLGFELKLLDLFHRGAARSDNIHHDVVELVGVFYESLGGAAHSAKQPAEVKNICCGLKRSLILREFRTAAQLRAHLETRAWS